MGRRLADGQREGNNLSLFVNGHSAARRFYDPCLVEVKPGEPIFVLRGEDKLAADLVRLWADDAEKGGETKEKVAEARALADEMEKWAKRTEPVKP